MSKDTRFNLGEKSTLGKLSITGIDILMLNNVYILKMLHTVKFGLDGCGMKLTVVKIKTKTFVQTFWWGKKVQVKA